MPPKIYTLPPRPAEKQSGPSAKQKELKAMFERFESVGAYLRRHGHSGRLILPLPPRMSNGYVKSCCHWVRSELRDAYYSHCDALLGQGLIPKPLLVLDGPVTGRARLYSAREGDTDNNMARIKWCCDWLTKRGYIVDDGPRHFDLSLEAVTVKRPDVRIEFELLTD